MSARPESFRADTRIDALRLPPQAVDAEQAVLGALMISPVAIDRLEGLAEEDFYRRDHRLIFRAIAELAEKGQPFDVVTVGVALETSRQAEQIDGGTGYLVDLTSSLPTAGNIRAHARIVREKSVLRQVIEAGTHAVNEGFSPNGRSSAEVLDGLIRGLMALSATKRDTEFALKSALKLAWEDAQDAHSNVGKLRGITTGYSRINRRMGGWHKGDLVLIGARPSMGKTALMVNFALHAAEAGHSVGIISGEQSAMQIGQRSLAADGRIIAERLRNGQFEDDDWSRLTASIARLNQYNVRLDDRSAPTLDEVGRTARRWKQEHGMEILFVDYLQRIRVPRAQSRVDEVAEVSRGLKTLARDMNIPVIALAQVKADVEQRSDKRPLLGDIANSDEATREADLIGFLYRDEVYDPESERAGLAELNFEKNRHGPTGQFTLKFFAETMVFAELEGEAMPFPRRGKPHAKPVRKSGRDAAAGDS